MADSEGREFYTYAYLREDRTPYYIGKGRSKRAWSNCNRKGAKGPTDLSRILILKKDLTEEEAFRYERYMIAIFGRKDLGTGILRNLTAGGEGTSGWVPNKETRAKIGEANRNRSEEARASMSKKMKGRSHTAEARAKMSEALRGEKNPNFGKKFSEEHRRRISESKRGEKHPFFGKTLSAEKRAKLSEAIRGERHPFFGKKLSEETRAKMSEAHRGEKSSSAKSFLFTSPSGEVFLVVGRFKAFCREQGISPHTMGAALYGHRPSRPRNGWLVRYAEH